MRSGDELQENPILLEDELLLAGEIVIGAPQRISGQSCAIGFIGGEVFDVVDAIGGGGRTFMRAEIADQVRTAAGNGLAPVARIFGEGVLLERVYLIADEAGDRGVLLTFRWMISSVLNTSDASASIEL